MTRILPVVGNDEESSDEDDSDDEEEEDDDCLGQVVLVLATRDGLRMHRRIRLPNHFQPTVAVHPSTYINKVVLGGTGGSMILVNVRSCKVVHTFTCLKDEGTITALGCMADHQRTYLSPQRCKMGSILGAG